VRCTKKFPKLFLIRNNNFRICVRQVIIEYNKDLDKSFFLSIYCVIHVYTKINRSVK